jgi:hypothetical protein
MGVVTWISEGGGVFLIDTSEMLFVAKSQIFPDLAEDGDGWTTGDNLSCHLRQCVRSSQGDCSWLDTKAEHYLLCGEAHHAWPTQEGDWHMWVTARSLFSLARQSRPDISRRKGHWKHSDKGRASITKVSKPFLYGLMTVTVLLTLAITSIFHSLIKESTLIYWILTVLGPVQYWKCLGWAHESQLFHFQEFSKDSYETQPSLKITLH